MRYNEITENTVFCDSSTRQSFSIRLHNARMEVYSFEKIMEKSEEFNEYKELYQVVQNKIGEKKGEEEMDKWEEGYKLSPNHCPKRLTFYSIYGDFICNFSIDRDPLIKNDNDITNSFYLNYSNKEAVDNWCNKVKTIHYWDGYATHIYENVNAFTMHYNDKAIELYVSCEVADYRYEEEGSASKEVKISKPEQYYMIYVKFSNNKTFSSNKVYAYEVAKTIYNGIDIGDIYQIAKVINRNPLIDTLTASGDLSSIGIGRIPKEDIIIENYGNSYIQVVGMEAVSSSKMILTSWRFIVQLVFEDAWLQGGRKFYRENWKNDIRYYDNNFHITYRHECKNGEISTNLLDTVRDYCEHPEKLKTEENKINGEKNMSENTLDFNKNTVQNSFKTHKFIFVRFADNKDNFNSYSKLYAYEIIDDFAANEILIGSIIKADGKYAACKSHNDIGQETVLISKHRIDEDYRGCRLRVEGIADYCYEEIPLQEWYRINWYFATDDEKALHANKENWTNVIHWKTDKINIEYVYRNNGIATTTDNIEDVLNHTNLVLSIDASEKPVKLYYEGPSLTIDETSPIYTYATNPIYICTSSSCTPTIKPEEIKEENTMSKIFDNVSKNMQFGKFNTSAIKYSLTGIAFRDKQGGFFTYNNGVATDVTGMTIDSPMFAMPIGIADIKPNDVILFKDNPVIVKTKTEDGIKVIDPLAGEVTTIIPETNIFNFNYVTKVINPFENMAATASTDNPFGNLLPLMMLGDDITKDNDSDMMKFLMISQMMGGKMDFTSNPMMLYMLMSDKDKDNDFFSMMMMMQLFNPSIPPLGGQSTYTTATPDWSVISEGIQIGDYPTGPEVTC